MLIFDLVTVVRWLVRTLQKHSPRRVRRDSQRFGQQWWRRGFPSAKISSFKIMTYKIGILSAESLRRRRTVFLTQTREDSLNPSHPDRDKLPVSRRDWRGCRDSNLPSLIDDRTG